MTGAVCSAVLGGGLGGACVTAEGGGCGDRWKSAAVGEGGLPGRYTGLAVRPPCRVYIPPGTSGGETNGAGGAGERQTRQTAANSRFLLELVRTHPFGWVPEIRSR